MTTVADPVHEQRMASLELATKVRVIKAEAKRKLREHEVQVGILADPTSEFERLYVGEFLRSIPGIGQSKVRRLLADQRLSYYRELGQLTERQRVALLAAIGHRHPRVVGGKR